MWVLLAERHVVHPISRRRSRQHAAVHVEHLISRPRAYQGVGGCLLLIAADLRVETVRRD